MLTNLKPDELKQYWHLKVNTLSRQLFYLLFSRSIRKCNAHVSPCWECYARFIAINVLVVINVRMLHLSHR